MIDGLQVTITGQEIRRLLDERIVEHTATAARWERETSRTAEDETEDAPLLPEHMCENEAKRERWRVGVLTFLRDHLEPSESYRLEMSDLEEAELLPARPECLDDEEFGRWRRDERDLGPFARRLCDSPEIIEVVNPDMAKLG